MESPVNFELKAEPVSPLWELELLDVGEVWEGDLGLSSEGDVKLIWEHEDASEFIGEGEPLFSLELDQIILEEDEELKEGVLSSFCPPDGVNRSAASIPRLHSKTSVMTDLVHNTVFHRDDAHQNGVCMDPNCAESVCTDASCCVEACTSIGCTKTIASNGQQTNLLVDLLVPNPPSLLHKSAESVITDDLIASGNKEPPYNLGPSYVEPFTSWLDSGAIYNGPSSNSLPVLPTTPTAFSPPNDLWTSPGSPPDEKPNVFAPGGSAAPSDPLAASSVDLLKEFEAVLNQAAGSLTPPDSPRSNNNVNVLLQTMSSDLHPLPLSTSSNQGFIVMQDIANCTGVVEAELDQLMAETINKNDAREDTVNKNGRPWDSPSASSSGASDSGYEDPDWSPAKSSESVDEPHLTKKLRLTSTEERRMRKKEQNKNAATRYRMKKKMEMEEIIGEEKGLQDRNETLKTEVVEITREIRYLKRLMGDLFRAKGLISAK